MMKSIKLNYHKHLSIIMILGLLGSSFASFAESLCEQADRQEGDLRACQGQLQSANQQLDQIRATNDSLLRSINDPMQSENLRQCQANRDSLRFEREDIIDDVNDARDNQEKMEQASRRTAMELARVTEAWECVAIDKKNATVELFRDRDRRDAEAKVRYSTNEMFRKHGFNLFCSPVYRADRPDFRDDDDNPRYNPDRPDRRPPRRDQPPGPGQGGGMPPRAPGKPG